MALGVMSKERGHKQMEHSYTKVDMGSPLGTLDPSHITNMVVDQAGLGLDHRPFATPIPPNHRPYQDGILLSPRDGMDSQPPVNQSGTPNSLHGASHMQHMQSGSPSLGQPVTPKQMMQQPPLTPGGQYPPDYQQQMHHPQQQHMHPQQQYQQIPQSPNHGIQAHLAQGGVMGNESSPVYQRQMMQQQQMMQAGPQHSHMNPMMGGSQPIQYPQYAQQPQQQGQPPQQPPPNQAPQAPPQGQTPQQAQQHQQQWAQQQQQHQMQQQHYQRPQMLPQAQAGQRVMIQRVPYPPAYMGGIPQQGAPAGAAPPYPVRPAPQAATQMQRTAYQGGQQAAPQPMPAYPQGHPGYQQQQYQPQMYQRQQIGQPMRPYISPQGAITPNHQAVYGAAPQQPTTPQGAQPPFAPGGPSRFPQATPSPHGQADLRSPNLMSPNQPMQPMPQPLPPQMNNGPMRMPPNVQPSPSSFYAHDPQIAANISPELCLAGCLFHILEIEKYTDKMDGTNLALAIRLRGGDVDFGPKTFNDKLGLITHVIVDSFNHPGCQGALSKRKRVVTLQWLSDTLAKGAMEVPTRLAHLPFCSPEKPFLGKYISISGFDESERTCLKWMIEACGAKMTPYLCKANTVLIAKGINVEKVEKAKEWGVPVVNYLWLADHYMGVPRIEIENSRYLASQQCEVTFSPYAIESMYEIAKQLLVPWKTPLIIQKEHWNRHLDIKKFLDSDYNVFPNKRLRIQQLAPPSEEEIVRLEKERSEKGVYPSVIVAFAGVDDDIKDQLSKKLRYLGGRVVDSVSECTHLVALQGSRSERFLEAIILGKNIVNAYWIVHGYECKQFMDTLDYFLRDEDMEKHLGYSCKRSVIRARTRPIFEDFTFYITPSVVPHRSILSRLIRLAGGKVDEERPDPAKLVKALETDTPFVVVGCEADLRVVQYLVDCGFPIFTCEFVLMSILRQEVEANPLYRVNVPQVRIPQMIRAAPIMKASSLSDTPTNQPIQPQQQRVRT
ncbi:unnamed protein product [Auanema sp. JU1783]|nr:unnamed protein product [Auanema sp. JU1783]